MALKQFCFQKILKNHIAAGDSSPRHPSVTPLRNTSLLTAPTNLDIFGKLIFRFWFKSSPFSKILVTCQTQVLVSDLSWYGILVHKKFLNLKIFDDVIACNFAVRATPQSKILATPINKTIMFLITLSIAYSTLSYSKEQVNFGQDWWLFS